VLEDESFQHPSIQTPRILPPRFVRLQTLKGENIQQTVVLMKYLLQNSQLTEV